MFDPAFKSPHLQLFATYLIPSGKNPPSVIEKVDIGHGDFLICPVSTPQDYNGETVYLVHGMGGNSNSPYMRRIARKLFNLNYRVVRLNLRNCGIGEGYSSLPYNGGTSDDLKKVIKHFGNKGIVVGFSLGGNIAIKMAGENPDLEVDIIGVCPALNLKDAVDKIQSTLYHYYFLYYLLQSTKPWTRDKAIRSINQFDNEVTAPLWGYKDANDYYSRASSLQYIPNLKQQITVIFAKDDPFIDYCCLKDEKRHRVILTEHGSHMGFVDKGFNFWIDDFVVDTIRNGSKAGMKDKDVVEKPAKIDLNVACDNF